MVGYLPAEFSCGKSSRSWSTIAAPNHYAFTTRWWFLKKVLVYSSQWPRKQAVLYTFKKHDVVWTQVESGPHEVVGKILGQLGLTTKAATITWSISRQTSVGWRSMLMHFLFDNRFSFLVLCSPPLPRWLPLVIISDPHWPVWLTDSHPLWRDAQHPPKKNFNHWVSRWIIQTVAVVTKTMSTRVSTCKLQSPYTYKGVKRDPGDYLTMSQFINVGSTGVVVSNFLAAVTDICKLRLRQLFLYF